jgi:uncharacterized phage protein gp47/JayE
MAFQRDGLGTIVGRVQTDIDSRVPGAESRLRRSVLGALARALAGAVHGLYGFISWGSRQTLPDTADDDQLDRLGGLWGLTRKAASYAAGTVTFTVTGSGTIPEGTQLRRADGSRFVTDADQAFAASGTVTTAVTAQAAGADGNTTAGGSLALVSPVSGVASNAVVAAGGLSGGADEESASLFRARILARLKDPPHGGAEADYIGWALEVPGVTRAWVYPQEDGAGTVAVRFVHDDDPSGIIPDAGEVSAVQDYIDAPYRRPVTADVTVKAPTAVELDLTIDGLDPDLQAVRDAIAAEIADMLKREATPGGTILISHIREAISVAAGEYDHALTSPTANVTHATGEIAVPGTITYT